MEESSSSYVSSDVEKEELLDRMLTRLALCDDSKLLPITISSLSSPSIPIRNKVLEMLSHVNKRVKHQPAICLPLTELWTVYTAPNAASMEKVANVSKLPVQHQEIILRIAARVIGECHAREIDDEVAVKYRSRSVSKGRELFLEFCLYTMLYQMPFQGFGALFIVPALIIFKN